MAKEVDYLFIMLGYPKDVEEMLLTKEALLDHLKPGSFVVDLTTSTP